jgi:hypothetical protein
MVPMSKHTFCLSSLEEEILRDMEEVEALVAQLPKHLEDESFKAEIFEAIEELRDLGPYSGHSAMIRKLVACFGDAYFFFNQTGNLCLLTDFLSQIRFAERTVS